MRMTKALFSLMILGLMAGCPSTGVGDPCVPEQIPSDGFDPQESYIEASSVQCRTRVCMVYRLDGDPSQSFEECIAAGGSPQACTIHPTDEDINARVFCSCRCDGAGGAPTCECGDGFTCTEILNQGGAGLRGSYCVPNGTVDMTGE